MAHSIATRTSLINFFRRLDGALTESMSLYLIGETSQLIEGWRSWTTQIEFTAEYAAVDTDAFLAHISSLQTELAVPVLDESPADIIPLPDGYMDRAKAIDARALLSDNAGAGTGPVFRHLKIYHFDPYSVSYRFIARGDEPDYHLVLMYIQHGWITKEELDARLDALIPSFTSDTIQQDPAEFRRKYKGLTQMWRAVPARTTHRPTTV